jgi:hypothetical protein
MLVVASDTWPNHARIVLMSTPDRNMSVAVECRMVCGPRLEATRQSRCKQGNVPAAEAPAVITQDEGDEGRELEDANQAEKINRSHAFRPRDIRNLYPLAAVSQRRRLKGMR